MNGGCGNVLNIESDFDDDGFVVVEPSADTLLFLKNLSSFSSFLSNLSSPTAILTLANP